MALSCRNLKDPAHPGPKNYMIFPQNQLNSFRRIVQMEMSNSVLSNVVVENSSWYQKTAAEDPFPQTATEERTEGVNPSSL